MYKSAMKCNETIGKWCKNKHGASKIIDTYEMYQPHTEHKCLRVMSSTNLVTRGQRDSCKMPCENLDFEGILTKTISLTWGTATVTNFVINE
jgi:hypothetical protein